MLRSARGRRDEGEEDGWMERTAQELRLTDGIAADDFAGDDVFVIEVRGVTKN